MRPANYKKSEDRIIQERLREVVERSRSEQGQPIEFATYLVIREGDLVPSEFRGLPNLKVDAQGVALADWEDAWCQSQWDRTGDWDNGWGECWDNTGPSAFAQIPSGIYETHVNVRRVTLADFSLAERITLARFGITK